MSPTDPILDAADVSVGNHTAPPAAPTLRAAEPASLTDRFFDRALALAVQLGAAKAQIAILTQSLQAAQAKAAEPGAARCSAATLRELFEYIKTQPIQAIKTLRADRAREVTAVANIVNAPRPGPLAVDS